ncbi:MAG: C4-dicarboxylate anaerobic carrier [bacterium P3]|nr:MAG: C4-dicarboxylate anaerobic carrier [bacterium P3]KWW42070.1 MAG: C4-dicarboxylate anaerobic carrier [bacterium F083]
MKRIPHTFTIVFALILLAAVCTWLVPGGAFVREQVSVRNADGTLSTREVVQGGSFHYVESEPQTWQVFSALFSGFCDKADIVIFILVVGGAFWILNDSHAIDVGVMAFLRRIRRLNRYRLFQKLGVENVIIVLVMIMFSLFGALFGMSEETIAFVAVFIPLAVSMGYDSLVGLGMCYVAAHIGFAGAMLNPFTIGIAQGIAGLPLFSGLEYRVVCWVVLTALGIAFMLWYARRVRRDPQRSPVYQLDAYWRGRTREQAETPVVYRSPRAAWVVYALLSAALIVCAILHPATVVSLGGGKATLPLLPLLAALFVPAGFLTLRKSVHFFILTLLLFTIAYLVVGVLGYGWYIREISALFLAMGIFSGIANSRRADDIAKLFLAGCSDILSAALVVGLASGIIFILKDGHVIDTILYGLTRSLAQTGEVASVGVMYLFQTLLNIVMPSGSAKAALTMPIMAQFADLIEVSRQTTVLAFQFGDGFTNMLTPTSGVLIGCLGVARIPYGTWLKWAWRFILAFILAGFLLLLPTLYLQLPGF